MLKILQNLVQLCLELFIDDADIGVMGRDIYIYLDIQFCIFDVKNCDCMTKYLISDEENLEHAVWKLDLCYKKKYEQLNWFLYLKVLLSNFLCWFLGSIIPIDATSGEHYTTFHSLH